jgi:hypothetical protein
MSSGLLRWSSTTRGSTTTQTPTPSSPYAVRHPCSAMSSVVSPGSVMIAMGIANDLSPEAVPRRRSNHIAVEWLALSPSAPCPANRSRK